MARRRLSCLLALMLAAIFPQAVLADTFTVTPSGDTSGVTDYNAIMTAFTQAVVAGPGSTVDFAAGDFYVHEPILVANFSGTVRGAGKGLTNLRTAEGVPFGLVDHPLSTPAPRYMVFYLDASWPIEERATVRVSDLSFHIDGPGEVYGGSRRAFSTVLAVVGRKTGAHDHEMTLLDASFERLEFFSYASWDDFPVWGKSSVNQIWVGGEQLMWPDAQAPGASVLWWKPITGTYSWKDIRVEQGAFAIVLVRAVDSLVAIGRPGQDRIVANDGVNAVELVELSNTTVEVSRLDTQNRSGIFVLNGWLAAWGNGLGELVPETTPEPSRYLFTKNDISAEGHWWGGIELWNAAGELGIPFGDLVVTHNKIDSVDHVAPYGPFFSYFIDDGVFTNNIVRGRSLMDPDSGLRMDPAVYIAPFGEPCSRWMLKGNNTLKYETDFAAIYLGTGTFDCTVVGGSCKTTVYDGNPPHNVLVGVTDVSGEPLGTSVSDAMAKRRDLRKATRD